MNRRSFLAASAGSLAACSVRRFTTIAPDVARPRPTPSQLAWQRDELALFFHFGVNTFTDREWGDGTESPSIFDPAHLDTRQWARAARNAGARSMILTAKHHDGFCLWPTRTTAHSVAASPWRSGKGDVVREFVDACRAAGLRPGLYLSPWDRNHVAYGDSPRYNNVYCDQVTELLTQYGAIAEVWFDGANGEGPNGRRQVYDWPRFFGLVRRLQPNAVIFSDAGPDVRWCGNERGVAGDPNWSTVDPAIVTYPGADGPNVVPALQHGDPHGSVWRPAEVDVSIRPGWFHHPAEDARVRAVDDLLNLYFTSVGRNGKLLLNVPPTREGLLHDTDVARLLGFRERVTALFAHDLAQSARSSWRTIDAGSAELVVDLGASATVGVARLEEDISRGQHVAGYTLYGARAAAGGGGSGRDSDAGGAWTVLSRGTTIGYTKLDRFEPAIVDRMRLVIDDVTATAVPQRVNLKLYSTSPQ